MARSPTTTSISSGNVTVVGKQGDYSPAAIVGGLRAPSPAPSEASTSSSNQSLDLMRCKKCSVDNCQEMLVVSGKRRKGPWMCSYHRNKTYKAKKKQKDQMTTNIQMFKKKEEENVPKPSSLQSIPGGEKSAPDDGLPRLDQVLNEKKLALLRSPAIIKFLQESQQQLSHTHHQQSSRTSFTPGHTSASSRDEHFLHASPPKFAKGGQM
ncbi:regulatory factor X-associated protein [Strongylocentrotus purpuratus]|uniref:Regulatory factor X-associated protein RFXANK-binding domain-containing protein n=1 Tax=Strongylocentrotus purpuratus TaxID=7668 RepID=A0A7M7RIZ1_STRPU|nr:regulatory factor X-associated protein [Strongylocentrotus purpuratus]|eukprot:XP_011678852.1 PREDICTED: regulatory factor X-associated protein isoform X2 [Strongylocentrotus purpuratus]